MGQWTRRDSGRRGRLTLWKMKECGGNLGLITGASVMGTVFTVASATIDITTARPEAVATGMRITFVVAAILIVVALAIAVGHHRLILRNRVGAPEADF